MLRDFNLHHPMWNPQTYLTHDIEADDLIDMASDLNLGLLLPPGTITHPSDNPSGGTTIDLVWGNDKAEDILLK